MVLAVRCQPGKQRIPYAEEQHAMKPGRTNVSAIKLPSALLPLALSLAGLLLVLGHAAVYGIVHEADEGAAAHVFWLLMGVQLPIVAYFAFRWLPRQPKQALAVLALQTIAWLVPWVAVYFLT